jgi:hypothetical protein
MVRAHAAGRRSTGWKGGKAMNHTTWRTSHGCADGCDVCRRDWETTGRLTRKARNRRIAARVAYGVMCLMGAVALVALGMAYL